MHRSARAFQLTICTIGLLVLPLSAQRPSAPTADGQITILQTTDVHDHANGADHVGLDLNPQATSPLGSYARMAAYINYVRSAAGHPVVLVDSGDWTMGAIYDLTLASKPLALSFLQAMKYDCVTLGNHEFDYGPAGLARMITAAQNTAGFNIPIVASNMSLNGNADLAPLFGTGKAIQTAYVKDLPNGIRVGFIGLMGEAAALDAAGGAPVGFAPLSAHYTDIQAAVTALRTTGGAQVVIALSHSGTSASGTSGEDVALARNVTGIDVIASGHTHTPLNAVHAIPHGSWTTQIIDAGFYGSAVARIDLTFHAAAGITTLSGFANTTMTDSALTNLNPSLMADPTVTAAVSAADLQINAALGPFFSQIFPDYKPSNVATGIYHPVGSAAQDMVSIYGSGIPAPNGLGDLVADSDRTIANSIIAQTLAAAGGDPTKMPGYDFTPIQAGVVASGVIRGKLAGGVPLSFADIFAVVPLGASPDTTQPLPVTSPLVSAYLTPTDMKQLCAIQLLAQSGLTSPDYYLNFSGIRYSLDPAGSYTYFKYATAGTALQTISQQAVAGSPAALQVVSALTTIGSDNGAALLAAYYADNPYAGVLVKLNDVNPTVSQIGANLAVDAEATTDAFLDFLTGSNNLESLVFAKAQGAIGTISGFAVGDGPNKGFVTTVLPASARVRIAADLPAFLLLSSLKANFGIVITPYKAATGSGVLSGADLPGLLANRINTTPTQSTVQELKEWMALLYYLQTGLKGYINPDYYSTLDFTQFPTFGAAVTIRNNSYPLPSITQFLATSSDLQGQPVCSPTAPVIAAITNQNYTSTISTTGAMIVWGSGFSQDGGNTIHLTRTGAAAVDLNIGSGQFFWDLSPNQINTALAGRAQPGTWNVTVTNACGSTSQGFQIAIQ